MSVRLAEWFKATDLSSVCPLTSWVRIPHLTNFLIFQSNSNFGKCIQNVRDYINVKLHTQANSAIKAASLHTFKNFSIIDEHLVQTNHFQHTITHTTPIAIGVTILELVGTDSHIFHYKLFSVIPFFNNLTLF